MIWLHRVLHFCGFHWCGFHSYGLSKKSRNADFMYQNPKLCNQVRSLSPFRSSDHSLEKIYLGFVILLESLLRKSIINTSKKKNLLTLI